jgi:hypothetical protein
MEQTGLTENHVEIKDQKIELEGVTLLHMNELRKWTQFLTILGFVGIGLILFIGVIMLVISFMQTGTPFDQLGLIGHLMWVGYITISVIYFFPVLYMYRFSIQAKKSLLTLGSGDLSKVHMASAIENLKKHFRYVGIVTIIILALYVVVLIGLLIAFALK